MGQEMNDKELDILFDAARAETPQVPQALMARVMADAESVKGGAQTFTGWRAWLAALGGAPGLGGLVTATCVGFWIGVAPPEGMPDLAGLVLGQESVELVEGDTDSGFFGWDIEEG